MSAEIQVRGLRQLVKACDSSEIALGVDLRVALRDVAQIVADETKSLLGGSAISFGGRTVGGVRARVASNATAYAEQGLRKSGRQERRRGNFGGLQMTKGFLPAVDDKKAEIDEAADKAVETILERYWR